MIRATSTHVTACLTTLASSRLAPVSVVIRSSSESSSSGVHVRIDGWDIRGRWFGVVVGATPRLGELRRGETIPWRVIAAQIAPGERRGSR